jgi:heat shock protein HslJ
MNFTRARSISFVFVFAALAATAFGQMGNGRNNVWKPVEVNGDRIRTTNAFVDFAQDGRRFSGNTGCNVRSGKVTVGRRGRVDIEATAVTRRACKMMEGSLPEESFLTALGNAVRYRRNGTTLDLMDRQGKRVVRFKLSARPTDGDAVSQKNLTDQKWYLESVGRRMTLVAIKGVFLSFDEQKRSAGGDTGCNVFGGSYTAGERKIAITNIISTMRACEEDGKMQLEREFLDGLRGADRYEIKDAHLLLYSGNKLLLSFRGEAK